MRFISQDDPVLSNEQGEPLGSNLYVYCLNNPVNFSDPIGHIAIPATLSIVLGAIASALSSTLIVVVGAIVGIIAVYVIVKIVKTLNKHIKNKKDNKLAASLAVLATFTTAATPPPPNNPKFRGTKTNGSVKLYEKGKVRVEVENMGNNTGNVHLQIKGDPKKYYYNPKDMQFYTNKSHTKLASKSIQSYLNDKKIVDAIAKGLTKYIGY